MAAACTASRQNGFAAPGWTGTPRRQTASRMLSVLRVVFSRLALPCTVLMPSKRRRGQCAASRMAKASWAALSARPSPWTFAYIVS
jgi:hypothetical protein